MGDDQDGAEYGFHLVKRVWRAGFVQSGAEMV